MRKTKNSAGAVIINKEFMNMPEIVHMFCEDGGKNLNVLIYVCYHLSKCKNAIGLTNRLHGIASYLKKYENSLEKIMLQTGYFVIDHEHGIFYSPRQRMYYGLESTPSEEEINDILTNGNIFYGRKKRVRNTTVEASQKTAKKEGRITEESLKKNLLEPENTDNQAKDDSVSNNKSKDITNDKSNVTTKEDACSSTTACSDDDVNEFKRILSLDEWRQSVHRCTGVNLEDASVLDGFANWMHNYCISKEKTVKGEKEIRRYAANLLRTDSKTRAEYDSYAASDTHAEEQNADTADLRIVPEDPDYEYVTNGMRYSCNGQLLPPDAPRQPSPYAVYSYMSDRWIKSCEYDKTAERKAYIRRRTSEPWYLTADSTSENTQKGGIL